MADQRRFGIKERKSICTKRWGVESRNNLVTSWCTSSWIWRKMEDDRVGYKELLVTRSNKRCGKICRRMQYVLADENRMKVLVEKIKPSKIPKRL